MICIGDKILGIISCVSGGEGDNGISSRLQAVGRVMYIHPKYRFIVAEMEVGGKFRETFQLINGHLRDAQIIGRQNP
jgi:hypothetical protein